MHCASKWRDPRIKVFNISDLTMGSFHADNRYKWRDLPSMQSNGMNYPLTVFAADEDYYWKNIFGTAMSDLKQRLPQPKILNDKIFVIKGGNNRYLAAKELGYTTIDCLVLDSHKEAILWMRYLNQCDPYHYPERPYLGLVDYK